MSNQITYLDKRDGQTKPVPEVVMFHWGVDTAEFYQALHTAFVEFHKCWAEKMNPGDDSINESLKAFPLREADWEL